MDQKNINNKLSFIDSFQFLSSSLVSLVKNPNKDDFEYFIQEFDYNVLDLNKLKGSYVYEYMSDCEICKEELPSKETFYSPLTDRKNSGKEYDHASNVQKKFEVKTMKDYHDLYLKCNFLSLADVFENFRNNRLKNYGLCASHQLSALFQSGCDA